MKEFDKYKVLFEWIYNLSESDRIWAFQYLSDKGVYIDTSSQEPLGGIINNDANRVINFNMKNAFRQRKIRERRVGKKAYSIVLSNHAKKTLDRIANDMAESQTYVIEKLLSEEKEFRSKTKEIKTHDKIKSELTDITLISKVLKMELAHALIKLSVYRLHEQDPASQKKPIENKKSEIEDIFKELWGNSKDKLKIYNQFMGRYHDEFNQAWDKLAGECHTSNEHLAANTDEVSAPPNGAQALVFSEYFDTP